MESQIEKDIEEAEERWHGLQTQSISNPGGRAIPPLTRALHRKLMTSLPLPSLTNPLPTETPEERLETRRTLTLLSITTGLGEIRSEETSLSTLKKPELDTSNTSLTSVEELDPFQRLLHTLKNSPRSTKQPQIEEMLEDKRPSGSRPKVEPTTEEAVIGTTVLVQVVVAEKEIKAALPRAFTGHRKDAKKFLRELFFLSYMTDGPEEFWKNDKTDLLLAFNPEAEKVLWIDFVEDFKTSFKPLDTALEAQLKLRDLKMKKRANEYMYQFSYLAKQTGYNNAAQIVEFKRGLPKSLVLKIMT
ncbi:hypothetical protein WG66_002263 [Moniliophthora roreri]|nr:hypothetical protein WG66_002263 [Moniliophthora roreri]